MNGVDGLKYLSNKIINIINIKPTVKTNPN